MSRKERERLKVVAALAEGRLTQVEVARRLRLCERQVRRVVLHLASPFPLQELFRTALARLTERRCLPTPGP